MWTFDLPHSTPYSPISQAFPRFALDGPDFCQRPLKISFKTTIAEAFYSDNLPFNLLILCSKKILFTQFLTCQFFATFFDLCTSLLICQIYYCIVNTDLFKSKYASCIFNMLCIFKFL